MSKSETERRRRAATAVSADAEEVASLIGSVPGMGRGVGDLLGGSTAESIVEDIVYGVSDASLKAEASEAASREREVARKRRTSASRTGSVRDVAKAEDSARRAEALRIVSEGGASSLAEAAAVAGAGSIAARRTDAEALLASLGIDAGVRLTRSDLRDMLSALMACGEEQLEAVMSDRRVPIAVKTVVVRLCRDCREGDTSTVERLWDRLFGKGPLAEQQSSAQAGVGTLVPSGPVSRQAYEMIRVRYFGEEACDEV